jgi:hypothetical protein
MENGSLLGPEINILPAATILATAHPKIEKFTLKLHNGVTQSQIKL